MAARDASFVFESLGLGDEPESRRPKVAIPDTLIFRRDDNTGRLALVSWLLNGKSGTVTRKSAADFVSQVKRWREKLVGTGAQQAGLQQPVAQAFGFDGVGQGVPPAGLDNLLTDMENGSLEGITMLQAKVKLGSKPAGHFEVESALDASGKLAFKARIAQSEVVTPAAGAALRSCRDDIIALAKRIVTAMETHRRVRVQSAIFEFVADSAAQPTLYLVGAYNVRTSLADGESPPYSNPAGAPYELGSGEAVAMGSPGADGVETVYLPGGPQGGPHGQYQQPYGMALVSPMDAGGPLFTPAMGGTYSGGPTMVQGQGQDGGSQTYAAGAGYRVARADTTSSIEAPPDRDSSPSRQRSHSPGSRQAGRSAGKTRPGEGQGAAGGSLGSPQGAPSRASSPSKADAMWADKAARAGAASATTNVAAAEVVAALKKQVGDLQSQLQAARLAAFAPPKTSALVIKGEPKEVADLRSSGRLTFVEEPMPREDAPKAVWEEVVRRVQHKCKEALDMVQVVQTAYGREASEAVSRLVEAHRRELGDIKSAYEHMEETVAQTNARLSAVSMELAAAGRREQAANDRAMKLMAENRKLANDLSATIAVRAQTQPSPSGQGMPPGLPRRPSVSRKAGAEILGLGPAGSSTLLPSPGAGPDESATFSYSQYSAPLGSGDSSALASAQSALLTMQAQMRQLQLELDATRDNLQSEVQSRTELAIANQKLMEEFRLERKRLKAQLSQMEEAEKLRVAALFTSGPGQAGSLLASHTASAGATAPASPSTDMSALLAKVQEAEEVQAQMTVLRAELAEARNATQLAATGRVEASRQLEAIQPVKQALESEVTALRSEVTALRAGSGVSVDAAVSSDRSSAARAVADANLARTELRAVREQLDRVRSESNKLSEQLSALRASRSAETESVRAAERAERDRVIREISTSHDAALRSALSSVQDEANKRFASATGRLQDEVMTLSTRLQQYVGEVAQLQARLRANEAEGKSKGTEKENSADMQALRASLDMAQSQIKALSTELNAIRESSARHAFEVTSQANAQFVALQAQHAQQLEAVKRDGDLRAQDMVKSAVAEAERVAHASVESARAEAASEVQKTKAASEEEKAKIIAEEAARRQAALAAVEAEIPHKISAAVDAALASARSEWQKASEAAVSAMKEGGQKSAAQMAESAAAAARKEVFESMGAKMRQLEEQLAMERASHQHTQQSLSAKDSAVSSLLTDIRRQAQAAQEAQAMAVAAAHSAATDAAMRHMSAKLSEMEAAWAREREMAVRSSVEAARAEAQTAFEHERQAFRKASQQAAEAMLAEADALVTSAKAEALRDKEAALSALRAELAAQYEASAGSLSKDINTVVHQRDAALAGMEARHAAVMQEAYQHVQSLQEALQATQSRAMAAEEEGRRALAEAESKLASAMEARLREVEAAWAEKSAILQADNEKAAGIIAGLLHEADEATRRANDASQALANMREELTRQMHAAEVGHNAAVENLKQQLSKSQSNHESSLKEEREKHAAALRSSEERWRRERANMETAFTQERLSLLGLAQAQEGAAMAAVEELRGRFNAVQAEELGRIRAQAEAEVNVLRLSHAQEMASLEAKLAEDKEAAVAAVRAEAAAKAAQALERVRNESNSAAEARIAALEADVARELQAAARAAAETQQAAVSAMETAHAQEVAALRADFMNRMDAATRALTNTEQLAAQQMSTVRAAYEAEVQALREQSVPLPVVQELRDKMEAQAVAALTSAVDEAVSAARREAEQLNAVLRQRIEEQDADRKVLSSQLDMLQDVIQQQINTSAEQISAARTRAERSEMVAEDLRSSSVNMSTGPDGRIRTVGAMQAEAAYSQRLAEMQAMMEAELKARVEEMTYAGRAQAEIFNTAREQLLAEKSAVETSMMAMQAATAEAVAERDNRIAELSAAAEAMARDLEFARGQGAEELKAAMRGAFEQERAAVETRAAAAVSAAVTEAIAAGEAAKIAALDEMRRHYEQRFREFETESRNLQAALISSLEAKHRQDMEASARAALSDRDTALGVLLQDRLKSLEDAQRVAQSMLDTAKVEHETSLANLRALHNDEKSDLVESHRSELAEALRQAKLETDRLLAEQDAAWREKAAAMLARAAEEQARAIQQLTSIFQEKLAVARAEHECSLMAAEEWRLHDLEFAQAGVISAVAAARAEGEADKIAALSVFNAEWTSRMQERVAQLLEEREAELTVVRAQYQQQLDETVQRLEAQRVAALEAFATEFAAERERLHVEKVQAVAEATQTERASGEAALALALSKAREEREAALAEQAAVLAEERARAIDAVRVQATEEQEEAMDALRAESEKLLTSIEGAMTRLRDERDVAQEDAAVLKEQLVAEKKIVATQEEAIKGLRRAGVVIRLHMFATVTRFASMLEHTKRTLKVQHEEEVARLKQEAAARMAQQVAIAEALKTKFRTMVKMRAVLAETLTSFKRDQLVEHRLKTTTLTQELAALAEEKATLNKQAQFHAAQVAEVEGTVRAIEREMAEISKQSVIEADGTVNVALTRKKKRLDRDMDAALVKINDRRVAQADTERKASSLDEERGKKEEELKTVEAQLVTTLVSQQRALMTVVTSIPLPPEELAITREEAAEMGLADPDEIDEMRMLAETQGKQSSEGGEGMGGSEQQSMDGSQGQMVPYDGQQHQAMMMGMMPTADSEGKLDMHAQAAAQAHMGLQMNHAAIVQAQQQLQHMQALAEQGQLGPQGPQMMQQLQMQIQMAMQQQAAQMQAMGMGMGMGMGGMQGGMGGPMSFTVPPPQQQGGLLGEPLASQASTAAAGSPPASPSKVALFWGNTQAMGLGPGTASEGQRQQGGASGGNTLAKAGKSSLGASKGTAKATSSQRTRR